MSESRKLIVPRGCRILWLLFVIAAATDDLVVQSALRNATLAFNQVLCNDDPGDAGSVAAKMSKYMSSI